MKTHIRFPSCAHPPFPQYDLPQIGKSFEQSPDEQYIPSSSTKQSTHKIESGVVHSIIEHCTPVTTSFAQVLHLIVGIRRLFVAAKAIS